jgi:hypothetical protein
MNGAERLLMSLRPTVHEGMIPPWKLGNDMTNDIRELSLNELDGVSGGTWMDTVVAVTTAVRVINDISGVLGKAVDGIPPASCHPKT